MLEIIVAVICTVFAGFFGTGILGNALNWPDAGAICAIETMGGFILHVCLRKEEKQENDSDSENKTDQN